MSGILPQPKTAKAAPKLRETNYKPDIIKRAEKRKKNEAKAKATAEALAASSTSKRTSKKASKKPDTVKPAFSDSEDSDFEPAKKAKTRKQPARKKQPLWSDSEDEDDDSDFLSPKKVKKARKLKHVLSDSEDDEFVGPEPTTSQPDLEALNRLECLRQIVFFKYGQKCLKAMIDRNFPAKVSTMILDYIVDNNSPITNLEPGKPLLTACKSILGDKTGAASLSLLSTCTEALFKHSIIRLDLSKWHEYDVPNLITNTLNGAKNIELVATAKADCAFDCVRDKSVQTTHPIQLPRATRILTALARDTAALANLKVLESLTLRVYFQVNSCGDHVRESNWLHSQVWRATPGAYGQRISPAIVVKPLVQAFVDLVLGSQLSGKEKVLEVYTTREHGEDVERRRAVIREEEFGEALEMVERCAME